MAIYPGARDFPSWRILECVVASEYQDLTEVKKDYFRIILSCGVFRMTVGGVLRDTILDTIFPEGTQTHANILAMLEKPEPPSP